MMRMTAKFGLLIFKILRFRSAQWVSALKSCFAAAFSGSVSKASTLLHIAVPRPHLIFFFSFAEHDDLKNVLWFAFFWCG